MATSLVKTASKVALGAGAVYVTLDQGVWSSNIQGSKALDRVRTRVLPAANEYIARLPSLSDIKNKIVGTWNMGVQMAFGGLASAPNTVGKYSKKALDEVKKNIK